MPPLVITQAQDQYRLGGHFEILQDHANTLSIEQLAADDRSDEFAPGIDGLMKFWTTGSVWVRFTISNRTDKDLDFTLVNASRPYLEGAARNLHWQQEDGTSEWTVRAANRSASGSQEVSHRHAIWHFSIERDETRTLVLNIAADGLATDINLSLWTPRAFDQHDRVAQIVLGLYYGIMLVMILYNLFLFRSTSTGSWMICHAESSRFRSKSSVMIALVDHDKHEVEVVRSLRLFPDNEHLRFDPDLKPGELGKYLEEEDSVIGFRYDLDDENITAVVAKTGELQIIDSQKDTRLDRRFDHDASDWKHDSKIAYFIPVKHGDRVVAVVATGSRAGEKEQTLERIDLMEPLLDLFAIALHNASLYKELHETNEALRENEQKLVRLERHRVLGEMSAGINHNLNNILTSVIGPAQLLKHISQDEKIHEEADHIIRAGERAQDLVYRLYRSAKGDTQDEQELVDINSLVKEAIQTTRPRWKDEAESRGAPIEITTELSDIAEAYVTASGLNDILINLIFNAIDAMEFGGTITIKTESLSEGAKLVVTDTGNGMDQETQDRVFEPFFTTKQDVGTGLGLSTVYLRNGHPLGRKN